MERPKEGDIVRVKHNELEIVHYDRGKVLATFDTLEEWWDGEPYGEAKMGLMDLLDDWKDHPEAEWYAVIELLDEPGVMAIASFEAELPDSE